MSEPKPVRCQDRADFAPNLLLRKQRLAGALREALKVLLEHVETVGGGIPLSELHAKGELPGPVRWAYCVLLTYDKIDAALQKAKGGAK